MNAQAFLGHSIHYKVSKYETDHPVAGGLEKITSVYSNGSQTLLQTGVSCRGSTVLQGLSSTLETRISKAGAKASVV